MSKNNPDGSFDPIGKIGCIAVALPVAGLGLIATSPTAGATTFVLVVFILFTFARLFLSSSL